MLSFIFVTCELRSTRWVTQEFSQGRRSLFDWWLPADEQAPAGFAVGVSAGVRRWFLRGSVLMKGNRNKHLSWELSKNKVKLFFSYRLMFFAFKEKCDTPSPLMYLGSLPGGVCLRCDRRCSPAETCLCNTKGHNTSEGGDYQSLVTTLSKQCCHSVIKVTVCTYWNQLSLHQNPLNLFYCTNPTKFALSPSASFLRPWTSGRCWCWTTSTRSAAICSTSCWAGDFPRWSSSCWSSSCSAASGGRYTACTAWCTEMCKCE